MTEETELCGFQTTGRSEDVPKPPKYNLNAEFWRTQWSEASGAHLMEYLRAEKLKKDNEILKKALTEISELSDPLDNDTLMSVVANVAGKALAAIGWGGCPVGAVGKNGLTKEEIEGSGNE